MVKKLFSLFLGLGLLFSANAQTESTISANDILYWVGEGEDQAILVVDFGETALAWGYRFDESDGLTVDDMVNDVCDSDPRFYLDFDYNVFADCFYFIERPQYQLACIYTGFKVNGVLADELDAFDDVDLAADMFVKISASSDAVWSTAITPATVKLVPVDATIEASAIRYWVGEGANSAVIAINWGEPDTALAWGLHFEGSITVSQAIKALDSLEDRLTYNENNDVITYSDGTTTLNFHEAPVSYLQFILNGNSQAGWNSQITDGSFLKIGESAFGEGIDSVDWGEYGWYPTAVVWPTAITPVSDPNAPAVVDATIDMNDIVYWVGEGTNKTVLVVNWADTSLAWGYKFNDASVVLSDIMDDIQEADPRFAYSLDDYGYLANITFQEGTVSLGITPGNYFDHKINGTYGSGLTQTVVNGDLNMWADLAAGVAIDSSYYDGLGWYYMYAYPMTITPVSVPRPGSISEAEAVEMNVYPNPANNVLNISVNDLQEATEAVLYDMTGRKVVAQNVEAGNSQVSIVTSSLPNGVYMLRVGGKVQKVAVRH
jgi:hypothetical protein